MRQNKGFSAVEMMFVLAIGAAILTMTFLAISSAQRSKRDTQRKNDLARLEQGLTDWANQNSGIYPDIADTVLTDNHFTCAGGTTPANAMEAWVCMYNLTAPEAVKYTIYTGAANTACPSPNGASTVYYQRISDRSYNIKMCLESGEVVQEHSS